jgi:hypothetical protein
VGDIHDALDRADRETFTREPPKTPLARIRLLLKAEKGSTRAVAARLGVTQRTVERYLAGTRNWACRGEVTVMAVRGAGRSQR